MSHGSGLPGGRCHATGSFFDEVVVLCDGVDHPKVMVL